MTGLRCISIFDALRAAAYMYYRVTKNKSTSAMQHLSANGSQHTCYDSVMTALAVTVELLLTPRGYLEAVHRIAAEFIATFFFRGKSLVQCNSLKLSVFVRGKGNSSRKCPELK